MYGLSHHCFCGCMFVLKGHGIWGGKKAIAVGPNKYTIALHLKTGLMWTPSSYVANRLTIPSNCNGWECIVGAQYHNGELPMTMQVCRKVNEHVCPRQGSYMVSRSFLTPSRPNTDTIYTHYCKDDVYNDVHGSYEHAHGVVMPPCCCTNASFINMAFVPINFVISKRTEDTLDLGVRHH